MKFLGRFCGLVAIGCAIFGADALNYILYANADFKMWIQFLSCLLGGNFFLQSSIDIMVHEK